MKFLSKSAMVSLLFALASPSVLADAKVDSLLNKIDADINAKRFSSPENNNAMDKIWQFKSMAPFDQRVNDRAYQVGEAYVELANQAISKKSYSQAQQYLDKAWMLASLTPGLDAAQDTLDKYYKGGSAPQVAAATKKEAAPTNTKPATQKASAQDIAKAKAFEKAEKEKRAKELAAVKKAQEKSQQEAADRRRAAEEKERQVAQLKKETEAKQQAQAKLASLEAQRKKVSAQIKAVEQSKAIAEFDLSQEIIENRETRKIRESLSPICQEILDNEASVVLHTQSAADCRWLTVRLTLCVRRLDKGFRLRHSYAQSQDEPSITLHSGRSAALQRR